MPRDGSTFRHAPARPPAVAARAMVATSQPTATLAGLKILEQGGTAADAAIAAAAVLGVTEPMSTGIGGDMFAIVHRDGELVGLDAAGPAPAEIDRPEKIDLSGPNSVDVPGAVAGWGALSERFGRLGLDTCLRSAIEIAERGFAVSHHAARSWADAELIPAEYTPAPPRGATVCFPDQAATLKVIAENGPDAMYKGPIADEIAASCWLSETDLAGYVPQWTTPLSHEFRGVQVHELPPPTQGVAALEALGILEHLSESDEDVLADQVRAVSLALDDAFVHVRDGADVTRLLSEDHLRARAAAAAVAAREPGGGTVYLCVVDEDRMAVSFIQSVFASFGSGVLVPGTGIVLNNRAACFAISGRVEPGRRPYHTLLPGMLTGTDGSLIGPFGVMGGFIQAQAHAQFVVGAVHDDMDPQAALDRARFRVEGRSVHLEPPLWDQEQSIVTAGLRPIRSPEISSFGGGQAIFVAGEALIGGSDARKDGLAAGL
jgi:gamma-glutamyltranspeptidase/glutathione hydrolase